MMRTRLITPTTTPPTKIPNYKHPNTISIPTLTSILDSAESSLLASTITTTTDEYSTNSPPHNTLLTLLIYITHLDP
jgi:hypothetical protein